MAWIEIQEHPALRGLGFGRPSGPVWPHARPAQPVRHPSRLRLGYRPRGVRRELPMVEAQTQETASVVTLAGSGRTVPSKAAHTSVGAGTHLGWRPIQVAAVAAALCAVFGGFALLQMPTPQPNLAATAPTISTPPSDSTVAATTPAFADQDVVTSAQKIAPLSPPEGPMQPRTALIEPPVVTALTPQISALTVATADMTRLPETADRPTTMQPSALTPIAPVDPFLCQSCVSDLPRFADVTVALFSADPAADVVQDATSALAANDVRLRNAAINPRRNQVRFYRTADAEAATILANRFGAALVDLRWFAPDADIARIDLFLTTSRNSEPDQK